MPDRCDTEPPWPGPWEPEERPSYGPSPPVIRWATRPPTPGELLDRQRRPVSFWLAKRADGGAGLMRRGQVRWVSAHEPPSAAGPACTRAGCPEPADPRQHRGRYCTRHGELASRRNRLAQTRHQKKPRGTAGVKSDFQPQPEGGACVA